MKKFSSFFFCLFFAHASPAAVSWYLDSSVATSGDGTSWATAAKTIAQLEVLTIVAGDTINISGGPSGSTRTYSTTTAGAPGEWAFHNGVTYRIGQDSSHNGTAIFDCQNGSHMWYANQHDTTFSGDAGDGARHFKVTNIINRVVVADNWYGTRISYMDFSDCTGPQTGNGGIVEANSTIGTFELDHCYFNPQNNNLDRVLFLDCRSDITAYDQVLIHDNLIYAPYDPTGTGKGADVCQMNGFGYSFYNNTIICFPKTGWTGSQHQDGWQGGWGFNFKIYNNRFQDVQNYAIYMEPAFGGYTDGFIVNNISYKTVGISNQAIAAAASLTFKATNVTIANNVTAGVGYTEPLTFRNPGGPLPAAFVNCKCYNNIDVNTAGGGGNNIDAGIAQGNQVSLTSAQGAAAFVSYSDASPSNNFNLVAGATSLIGQGFDLSSVFTFDFAGATRTVPWDVGAYKYSGAALRPGLPGTQQLLIAF